MKYISLFVIQREALVVMVVWKLGLHLAKKSLPITTKSGEFDS
jgi:hypothetical protein